jgi:hypothetical protein
MTVGKCIIWPLCVSVVLLSAAVLILFDRASAEPAVVGYWPFDEGSGTTVGDASGHGNDGTVYGPTWVPGISGSALDFDGVDDYVEVPDAHSLSGSTVTIDFWIKPNRVDREQILVNKYYDMDSSRSEYLVKLGDALDNGEKAGLVSIGDETIQSADVISNVGQWYHIVAVVRGCQSRIYVDADPVATGCLSPMSNTTTPLVIGRYAVSYHHQAFDGVIDEVKISVASPVGGIAELPDVSDSAGRNYVALAALAAAALVALGAGGE